MDVGVAPNIIYYASCAFLVTVFGAGVSLAAKGNQTARSFLWVWAALLVLALPFISRTNIISEIPVGLMVIFFLYILYLMVQHGRSRIDVSHEETRRVLAESNRRIDEERRMLARRLHDGVNPQLLLSRNVLKQLEPLVHHDERAASLVADAIKMLMDAYAQMRDIIKNTRIEVIDSIGFTAALESMVAHYANICDKPTIKLDHNLPKRPELPEAAAVSTYKIIREALFNAIKHASANHVGVSVHYNKSLDLYSIEVVDDGVGVKTADDSFGIGLIDMRERARVLGGVLKVEPAAPANPKRPGTRVRFSFSGQSS